MQESYLYEYAVIRLVPKVEREEFINIGLILFSKHAKYIKTQCFLDKSKVQCLFNFEDVDWELIEATLIGFKKISLGEKEGGALALLDIPERFRWLTSVKSTIIQTSRPHIGFSTNLEATFETLCEELIL